MKNAMIGGLVALFATGCVFAYSASARSAMPLENARAITLIGWGDNGQGGGYGGTPQNQGGGYGGQQNQGGGWQGGSQPQNQGGTYNDKSGNQGGTYNNNNQGTYDANDNYPKKKKRKNQSGTYPGQGTQGDQSGYGGNNQGGNTQGSGQQGSGQQGSGQQGGGQSGQAGSNGGTSGSTGSSGGSKASQAVCLGHCQDDCRRDAIANHLFKIPQACLDSCNQRCQ